MNDRRWSRCRAQLAAAAQVVAAVVLAVGSAIAATPAVDEAELLKLGFKVLVATTDVQRKQVNTLPPHKFRALRAHGRETTLHLSIPTRPATRIFVDHPAEYAAYAKAHPEVLKARAARRDDAAKEAHPSGRDSVNMQAASCSTTQPDRSWASPRRISVRGRAESARGAVS